jgi:hypothetical protein
MPDGRLQRTRDNYRPAPCGHQIQHLSRTRIVTLPDGTSVIEREPLKMRVRSNGRFCPSCSQVVDEQDEAEADRATICTK